MIEGYNEKKFLTLTPKQQHKRCAILLQRALTNEGEAADLIDLYTCLYGWMKEPFGALPGLTQKDQADWYHKHLEAADLSLKEHSLLTLQRKGDLNPPSHPWPIDIYLDNLRSAHNVGSIIRTTEALRLGDIYFSEQTPFIDNPKVQKTSMGCLENVNCKKNIPLDALKKPLIALETAHQAQSLYEFTFPPSFTLVIGNEEYGCSETSLQNADVILEIPLRGRKNSLNVANAFACVASEISRQKCSRMTP